MNVITYASFKEELEKISAFIGPAADLAGLGMLAVPGLKTLHDKDSTAKEKNHAKWETGGLATLGAGVAINDRKELMQGAKHFREAKGVGNKLRSAWNIAKGGVGRVKHASVRKLAQDLWNPGTGEIVGGAMGKANHGIASAGTRAAQAAKKPAFTAAHLAAAKAKMPGGGVYQGIKRGVGAAAHLR